MLILRRKAGEALHIGDDIRITVISVDEGGARLAIEAPREIPVLREELLNAMDVNRDAAEEQNRPEELLKALFPGQKKPPEA
ncbi:MAG: carbon storage regulator [Clostridiaceae bacterium]|nr:carbon storage regulator [Clostridiaceae bacterium]